MFVSSKAATDGRRAGRGALSEGLEPRRLLAGDGVELVRDVNRFGGNLAPEQFVAVGPVGFFVGRGGTNEGKELWRTDGTTAGTARVSDIVPGNSGSDPAGLVNVNGTLYFSAADNAGGRELWKSDGTEAGTVRVVDVRPGTGSSNPQFMTSAVGGWVYFAADAGDGAGAELFRTDGTAAGTARVSDVNPGPGSADPRELVAFGDGVLFAATGPAGRELYKADAAGVVTLVADLDPAGDADPRALTAFGGQICFTTAGAAHRGDLWRTDGTAAGTVKVKQINLGTGDTTVLDKLTPSGNLLYFLATDTARAEGELWRTDGTAAGTFDLPTNAADGPRRPATNLPLSPVGDHSVWFADVGTPFARTPQLWRTDGTHGSFQPGALVVATPWVAQVGGTIYYARQYAGSSDTTGPTELWQADGLVPGNGRRIRAMPDAGTAVVPLGALNGELLLAGWTSYPYGTGSLFKTDGTAAGTVRIGTAGLGTADSLYNNTTGPAFATLGDQAYFVAADGLTVRDGTPTREVWRVDPLAGTSRLTGGDRPSGSITNMSSAAAAARTADGTAYLAVLAGGNAMLLRLLPGGMTSAPVTLQAGEVRNLTPVGNDLYYIAASGPASATGWLYRFNAAAGTVGLVSLGDSLYAFQAANLTRAGAAWYFTSAGQLYQLAGPGATPTPVRTAANAVITGVSVVAAGGGGVLYYARGSGPGAEIWRTDGTSAGTVRVSANAGTPAGQPRGFSTAVGLAVRDAVVYFADESARPWRTDGTAAGTYRLNAGALTVDRPYVPAPDGVYFVGRDAVGNRYVYRTDGTVAGTVQTDSPWPAGTFIPTAVHPAGGRVFMVGYAPGGSAAWDRLELWELGTPSGGGATHLLRVLAPAAFGQRGSQLWDSGRWALASSGDSLYFPAFDPTAGLEPHRLRFTDSPSSAAGTVRTKVFEDTDPNGGFDPYDHPLADRTVYLDLNDDGAFDPATEPSRATDLDGEAVFDGVPAGTYALRQVVPAGGAIYSTATLPTAGGALGGAYRVTVAAGGAASPFLFGSKVSAPPRFVGAVFDDQDLDGAWDPGEPNLPGRTVYIDANDNGQLDPGELSRVTAADGYAFWNPPIPSGGLNNPRFVLRQVLPPRSMQTAPAGGAGRVIVIGGGTGNDPAPSGLYVNHFGSAPATPTVLAVRVNDGSAQRSRVTSVTVTFDRAVVIGVGAFALAGRNGAGAGTTVSAANPISDGRTWVLTFAVPAVVGGGLPDGVYDLTVVAAEVRAGSAGGPAMAADYGFAFHRLFSDADGDGDSDNADLFQFRASYGRSTGDPAYRAEFDYDLDGDVDNADLFQVRSRRSVEYKGY